MKKVSKKYHNKVVLVRGFSKIEKFKNGTIKYFLNGKLHREDGPAIEWSSGKKSWFLNNIEYSYNEWEKRVMRNKIKRLSKLETFKLGILKYKINDLYSRYN